MACRCTSYYWRYIISFTGTHVTYWIDGAQTTYNTYISAFNTATTRETRFHVPVDAPITLYLFGYSVADTGIRCVIEGYALVI